MGERMMELGPVTISGRNVQYQESVDGGHPPRVAIWGRELHEVPGHRMRSLIHWITAREVAGP